MCTALILCLANIRLLIVTAAVVIKKIEELEETDTDSGVCIPTENDTQHTAMQMSGSFVTAEH